MASASSTILIEEITSQPGQVRRSILLSGPTLPFMGPEWGSERNEKITWYPGNSQATWQLIGPKAVPMQWQGHWSRQQMGSRPAIFHDVDGTPQDIVDPSILREKMEQISLGGRIVRVTWTVQQAGGQLSAAQQRALGQGTSPQSQGSIVREGSLTKFSVKPETWDDMPWEATFNWTNFGTRQAPAKASRAPSLGSSAGKIKASTSQLKNLSTGTPVVASNPSVLNSASFVTLGQLESFPFALEAALAATVSTVVGLADRLSSAALVGQQVAVVPLAVQQDSVAAARLAVTEALLLEDQLGQTPWELQTLGQEVKDILAAIQRYQPIHEELEQLALLAAEMRDELQAQLSTPPLSGRRSALGQGGGGVTGAVLGFYVVKAGDTPETIARAWYGDDTLSTEILNVNGLPWHIVTLPPGLRLLIPRVKGSGVTKSI